MLYQKSKQVFWFILYVSLLIILAACQPGGNEGAAPEGDANDEEVSSSLVIYSGRSESLVQPIIDQFADETGINGEVRYGSTSEIAGVLLEEGENSPADLFYAQDPGGLGAVSAAGMLAQLPEATTNLVPARFAPDDRLSLIHI